MVARSMTDANEYTINGDAINKLVETYKLEIHMLPGQVFETIQKKLIKTLADQIEKNGYRTVRFVNLEAIASGPHKDFLYPIVGGLTELIDLLMKRGVTVTGTIEDRRALPLNLVYRIERSSKSHSASDAESSGE